MLKKLILATVVAIATTLACVLVGGLLASVDVTVAVVLGTFLKTYSTALGILSGLWYFFTR